MQHVVLFKSVHCCAVNLYQVLEEEHGEEKQRIDSLVPVGVILPSHHWREEYDLELQQATKHRCSTVNLDSTVVSSFMGLRDV